MAGRILPAAGAALVLSLALSGAVAAHTAEGTAGGFAAGLKHPVLGVDHLVAMVAVGLWGAFLGRPLIWVLPVIFPLLMAFGAVAGMAGLPLPHVETGIAASAVVLGLCILAAFRPPVWAGVAIVAAFGLFHGHAHGTELPVAADPLSYAAGFVLATGLLHLAGVAVGLVARYPGGLVALRACGGVVALIGVAFLTGVA